MRIHEGDKHYASCEDEALIYIQRAFASVDRGIRINFLEREAEKKDAFVKASKLLRETASLLRGYSRILFEDDDFETEDEKKMKKVEG